jgi:hypothetical protein
VAARGVGPAAHSSIQGMMSAIRSIVAHAGLVADIGSK